MIDKNDFNAKKFLKGFDEELQNIIEIESFYTSNGRNTCARFKIGEKEFEAEFWNTFSYFYGERPTRYKNYILSYSIKEVDTKVDSICICFTTETFEEMKIDLQLMKRHFEELR